MAEGVLICDACNSILEEDMMATPCGHIMHASCLERLFRKKPDKRRRCPTCSMKMRSTDCKKMFVSSNKDVGVSEVEDHEELRETFNELLEKFASLKAEDDRATDEIQELREKIEDVDEELDASNKTIRQLQKRKHSSSSNSSSEEEDSDSDAEWLSDSDVEMLSDSDSSSQSGEESDLESDDEE